MVFASPFEKESKSETISKFQKGRAIEFGVWYFGMEKKKVEAAYDRFLKETKNT